MNHKPLNTPPWDEARCPPWQIAAHERVSRPCEVILRNGRRPSATWKMVDCFTSFRGKLCSSSRVAELDTRGALRGLTVNNVFYFPVFIWSRWRRAWSVTRGHRERKKTCKLRCLRPGCRRWCTLIRLIPLSVSTQNQGHWVHANASVEGRSQSVC